MAESLYKKFEGEVDEHTKLLFKHLHDLQLAEPTSFLYSLNNIWKDYCEQMVCILKYSILVPSTDDYQALDPLNLFIFGPKVRAISLLELEHDWCSLDMVRIIYETSR